MTLVTTPGAADATSLVSLADAEVYMGRVIFKDEWIAATNEQKEAALILASELLSQLPWKGVRTTASQALCWPRRYGSTALNPTGEAVVGALCDRDGYVISTTTIPNSVKAACCEFALRLISEDRLADAGALTPQGTLKIGSLSLGAMNRSPIPPSVKEKVMEFLLDSGMSIRLVRG